MRLMHSILSMILGFSLMSVTYADNADGEHEQHAGHRHHDAHVHGMATLDLVMDGEALMIHLQSPLMNFLGFEHQPETAQQKHIYRDMLQQFELLETLLTVEGASCHAESIEIDDVFANQNEAGHTDIDISYFLRCEQPDKITGLQINLFDIYNRLELLQVQMVLPSGQQQLELNPQRTTLRIN